MSFSWFAAFKFLSIHREQRFLSWITSLSIAGVAIGVATMIVVLSVINGFETELRNRFLAANAHILMYRFPSGIRDSRQWEKKIFSSLETEITGISPFIHSETMGRKDSMIHSVLVRGIDPVKRQNVQDLKGIVRPESALTLLEEEFKTQEANKVPAVIVGIRLMELMNAKVGDTIDLISPRTQSTDDPFRNTQKFKIVGTYDSGLQHYDVKLCIMSIPAAQHLFGMNDSVTGLEIGLKDPNKSPEIAKILDEHYNLTVKEWQSYNQNIFQAMKTERLVIALIVALVAFVASFNILTTLFVLVTHKQREISLLKSLGAPNKEVLFVFLHQGSFLGIFGGLIGVVLALILAYIIENYKIIDLPEVYLLAKLPVQYDWRVYLAVSGGGILIASLAGLYPAWIATKVSPTQGLNDNLGN